MACTGLALGRSPVERGMESQLTPRDMAPAETPGSRTKRQERKSEA